ncbi:S1C family serine protease [Streptomyces brasiliscabiei]|uniref:S1C family serine protease n=1 Tax=Streptomyces brasiliscabiei TaxID=2736302 RepID=UPI001F390233|nr:trypsin-like peptidase domain-containing protein [Streptomyces brasiliscabiei]
MNEGKPTKAKWWSRPRAHGATGAGTTGEHVGEGEGLAAGLSAGAVREENPEGDFELERPAPVTAPASGEDGIRAETGSDPGADFELARPDAESPLRSRSRSTSLADVATGADGDFELERPAPPDAGPDAGPGVVLDAAADGDSSADSGGSSARSGDVSVGSGDAWVDLYRSAAGPGVAEARSGGSSADAAEVGAGAVAATAAAVPATGVVDAVAVAEARPTGAQGALSAPDAPSERPRPLHAPDPYGTPPYGEPGPWAPAPPVQHPATTPAHGTDVRPASSAHDVPAMAGASAHTDATSPVPPAHGTAVPSTAATSGPEVSQPPGASYAYPSQPGPPPYGDSAQAVPPPYAGGPRPVPPPYAGGAEHAQHPRPTQPSQVAGGHQPPAAYAEVGHAPHAGVGTAPGPWQNYDPWAGSGSLQQNGAAVDGGPRRRGRGKVLLVGAVLIAVVAGGIGGAVGAYLERNGGVGAIELPQTSDGVTGRAPDSVAGIAARALPGVVTLHVSGDSAQGTGTGFVLDERGHILTNNHVVDPAGTNGDISVTFSGGETAKATVVGRDTGYDLAVVKVSGVTGLDPLPLGNSEEVRVGDPVVAIGAPFDLANTVTSGIISAKERPITAGGESGDVSDVSYVDALQTDAPINPGNSGGPLLDGKGRVIGINSAIRSAGSGSESDGGQAGSIGLGFAIPINQGKRVAEELINTGKATHPVIGVTLDMDYSGDGARVGDESDGDGTGVTSGGPADRAGIRSGDVITAVDGQRVHSGDELIVKVRAHRPGDRLELTLRRDGGERTVTLTLGSSGGA